MHGDNDGAGAHELKMKKKLAGYRDDFMGDRNRFISKQVDKTVDQIPNAFEYSKEIVERLMIENVVIKENPKTLIKKNKAEEVLKERRDEKLVAYMVDQMEKGDSKKKFEKLTSLLEITREQYLAT